MSSTVPDSRIVSTTTAPYDCIVGLTQGHINESFLGLYNAFPELHAIKMKNINGEIDAQLLPPEIVCDVTSGGNFVYFYMKFKTGTMTLNSEDTGNPVGTWKLDDCQIGFAVRIGMEGVPPDSPNFSQTGLDPKDFSLQTLFMDITAADVSNPIADGTKMPNLGGADASYSNFILAWMTQVKTAGANILGLHASQLPGQNPYNMPASFPPTSVHLQPYPYLGPSQAAPVTGIGETQNCLVYAEMTNHKNDPSPNYYPYTGNLNNATQLGTMMLSQDIFWNQWLLPFVQELNYQTLLTGAYCSNSGREGTEDWKWGYQMGPAAIGSWNDPKAKDASYSGYAWNKITDGKSFGFNWNKYSEDNSSHGPSGSNVSNYVKLWTQNYINVTPGSSNTITVGGSSTMWSMCHTDARGTAHSTAKLVWEFQLNMDSIDPANPSTPGDTGGLRITLKSTTAPVVSTGQDGDNMSPPTWIEGSLQSTANTLVPIITSYEEKLAEALAKRNRFVFPANGTFNMFDPVFNNNLDLLVGLAYIPGPQPKSQKTIPSQQEILQTMARSSAKG